MDAGRELVALAVHSAFMAKVSAGQVFVAGGLPTVTYNPRAHLLLEDRLRDYLSERHKIISVSGPTKSGKTVLLRSVIKDGVWIAGGEIDTVGDFWANVGDKLEVLLSEQIERRDDETTSTATSGGGQFKPLGIGGAFEHERGRSNTTGQTKTQGRTRPLQPAVKDALAKLLPVVVIDDFHYVPQDVQLGIVRGLKDLVFGGLGVVLAAVPHRAYDAVRVEKEMTGRVVQLPIEFWSEEELMGISREGFAALNVNDPGEVLGRRLADESFGSPFLMQDFCLQLVKDNDVRETATVSHSARRTGTPSFRLRRPPHRRPPLIYWRRGRANAGTGSSGRLGTGALLTSTAPFSRRSLTRGL